jgi:hypothetical protein
MSKRKRTAAEKRATRAQEEVHDHLHQWQAKAGSAPTVDRRLVRRGIHRQECGPHLAPSARALGIHALNDQGGRPVFTRSVQAAPRRRVREPPPCRQPRRVLELERSDGLQGGRRPASVGFSPAAIRSPLLGLAGCLEFFDTCFRGADRIVEAGRPATTPPTLRTYTKLAIPPLQSSL